MGLAVIMMGSFRIATYIEAQEPFNNLTGHLVGIRRKIQS